VALVLAMPAVAAPICFTRAGDTVHVEIAMEAMPAEMVHLVEGNLNQVVGVRSVSRVARTCLRQVA